MNERNKVPIVVNNIESDIENYSEIQNNEIQQEDEDEEQIDYHKEVIKF